jgi:dihydrofolate reductase
MAKVLAGMTVSLDGFVTDGVDSAVTQAKRAAKGRDVTCIGGVDVIRQLFAAGLIDELRIDVMPELLGTGMRLFDDAPPQHLELLGVDQIGARTSMRFRVPGRG